ncbi:hypothetical protein NQ318_014491 [Aromia moschata]|uniref:Uncharacterized protein n=1 Tax=Aromia moschata TaxID=1265417 RepID=A0AAV8YMD7_9CUCU|nr:hypothetical protein NQ318_014491 [Aromia moschata]
MNSMIVLVFAAVVVAAANAGVLGGVPLVTPWSAPLVASPWAAGVVSSPLLARSVVASPLAHGLVAPGLLSAPGLAATRSVVAGPSGTIVQDSPALIL